MAEHEPEAVHDRILEEAARDHRGTVRRARRAERGAHRTHRDAVRGWGAGTLEATVAVRLGIPFFEPGQGVPAHIGIEYMAQACGAYAGLQALAAGEPVRVGLLLGTRRYLAQVGWFEAGQALDVKVTELFRDGSIGMFGRTSFNENVFCPSVHVMVMRNGSLTPATSR